MQRKLLLLACIAFVSMGLRCSSTSPTSPENLNSGITGTTRSVVVSGVPGGPTLGGPASIEFAIAPVQAGKPLYERAMFIKSDAQGMFRLELRPATYWIGSKAKALDPAKYAPDSLVFSEMVVEVKEGAFTSVELVETGVRP